MLQVNQLTLTHTYDLKDIVNNLNLVLNVGDKAVLIGEEGNGKSTLLKYIYNPKLVSDYIEAKGSVNSINESLAYLPQELPTEVGNQTIYDYFSNQEMFWQALPNELNQLARQFNLDGSIYYSDQLMKSLSGGEKVKLQLMALRLKKASILLLDEPSNDIDTNTLEVLEQFINQFDGIVLFISHDETLIEHTANKVIHMERILRKKESKVTVANMDYSTYAKTRAASIEKTNQQAANDARAKRIRDEKYMRVYQSVEHALRNVSRQAPNVAKNLKDKMHTVKSMGKRFDKADEQMTHAVDVEESINFQFNIDFKGIKEGKKVLEYHLDELTIEDKLLATNIDLTIKGSSKVCIIGKNGCGKTTLIKKIAKELAKRNDIIMQYMPQNYLDALNLSIDPVNYLMEMTKESKETVMTYLGALKFTFDEMNHSISMLSGGQKAKLFLIQMALSKANVLILDEPTRNFSPLSQPVIRQMLAQFNGAILSVSHDRKYIEQVCDKIYELTNDGLVEKEKNC